MLKGFCFLVKEIKKVIAEWDNSSHNDFSEKSISKEKIQRLLWMSG